MLVWAIVGVTLPQASQDQHAQRMIHVAHHRQLAPGGYSQLLRQTCSNERAGVADDR